MLDNLKYDIVKLISSVEISTEDDVSALEEQRRLDQSYNMQYIHDENEPQESSPNNITTTFQRDEKKVGRNDPCWCGTGKKYKNCHGSRA